MQALTRHPATFLLTARGRVESLALSQTDPLFAANIKRAIVSLLQVQRPPTPNTTAYTATDSDIIGTCTSQHTVARRGADHVIVSRSKQPHRDCEYRAVHHGSTSDADRAVFSRNSKGTATTTHYFHRITGFLDKVRFAEQHSAALHGDPRAPTTASSTGYLRRMQSVQGAAAAVAAATTAIAAAARSPRELHAEFGTMEHPVILEAHSLHFQHGDQTHPSSLDGIRRSRRNGDGSSSSSNDDDEEFLDAGRRLTMPELQGMRGEMMQWLMAVQAEPTASGAAFHRACVAVREHERDLVPILAAVSLGGSLLAPTANSVLAGSGSDVALAALWPQLASGALGRQPTQGLLMTMASVPRPTAQMLARVRALISTNATDYQVSVTGALVLGALVRQVSRAGSVAQSGAHQECRHAMDMLIEGLRHATHEEHRTLFVHALGNAGDPDALPYLEDYMYSRQSRSLRLAAIGEPPCHPATAVLLLITHISPRVLWIWACSPCLWLCHACMLAVALCCATYAHFTPFAATMPPAPESVRHMPATLPRTIRARRSLREQFLDHSNDDEVRILAYRTLADNGPRPDELATMAHATRWHRFTPVGVYVHRHLRGMAANAPDDAQRRVARGLLDDLKDAGVVVDFNGTNLTQFSLRLGFQRDDEYFFVGDQQWGVSVGLRPHRNSTTRCAHMQLLASNPTRWAVVASRIQLVFHTH